MVDTNKKVVVGAMAGVVSMGFALASSSVLAISSQEMEKCYAIARVGKNKNDCDKSTVHSCQSQGEKASNPSNWIFVPTGTCNKIVGGTTQGTEKIKDEQNS